jgi:hypothetical protein
MLFMLDPLLRSLMPLKYCQSPTRRHHPVAARVKKDMLANDKAMSVRSLSMTKDLKFDGGERLHFQRRSLYSRTTTIVTI